MHRGYVLIGSPGGGVNLRLQPALIAVGAGLFLGLVVLGVMGLCLGTIEIDPARVLAALTGHGDPTSSLIIVQWRLPRVLMAVIVGGALGMAGAIFQSLLRNPLGSPDVIGFGTGAYSGGLIAMILFAVDPALVALCAIGGGTITAALVYLLSWRNGLDTTRLILIGVAVSAMLSAFNHWLMLSGSLEATMGAATWGAGSLAGIGWAKAWPSATLCVAGGAACLVCGRRLRLLEMGDDIAGALGLNAGRNRAALVLLGTALTASATAEAGPIAFIALAAPQLAAKLARTGTVAPMLSGLVGALLLLSADLVAQHLFAPTTLPVGLITLCIGGIYLAWLLMRQKRICL